MTRMLQYATSCISPSSSNADARCLLSRDDHPNWLASDRYGGEGLSRARVDDTNLVAFVVGDEQPGPFLIGPDPVRSFADRDLIDDFQVFRIASYRPMTLFWLPTVT